MSWKKTDPIELWKTSTTLPVPAKDVQATDEDVNRFGNVRTRFWMSLNEMSPKRRTEYFHQMLSIWPFEWERRAIKWSINILPVASFFSVSYLAVKITGDVFLVNPKLNFFTTLRRVHKISFIFGPCATLCSQMLCHVFMYQPFVEHEGELSAKSLALRAMLISLGTSILFPLISVPPGANSALYNYQRRMGMRPFPQGTMLDLITQTYECSRSVRSKLPVIALANLLCVAFVVGSMAWARERIHSTIDLDPELIQTLMADKDKQQKKPSAIGKGLSWVGEVHNSPMNRNLNKQTLLAPSSWQQVDKDNDSILDKFQNLFSSRKGSEEVKSYSDRF